jgi:hypothetical protein
MHIKNKECVKKKEHVLKINNTGVVFSGYSGFFIIKSDRHDITEILLEVALNPINLNIF